jgi:hypothetical protein
MKRILLTCLAAAAMSIGCGGAEGPQPSDDARQLFHHLQDAARTHPELVRCYMKDTSSGTACCTSFGCTVCTDDEGTTTNGCGGPNT